MARSSSPLTFTTVRRDTVLVAPAGPTPRELKSLSDIDNQESARYHVPFMQIYSARQAGIGDDPAKVIREALGKALVHYYPWAGRLREVGPCRKLVVDCTGEGVVFVEAEADVRLEDLASHLHTSFPCYKDLFSDYNIPGTYGILDSPLLFIQVTRLRCGGFVMACRINHTITDSIGLAMLFNAMAEIARGASHPSVLPVWRREILSSRNPPRVTFPHPEYKLETGHAIKQHYDDEKMVDKSFFFGPSQVSVLRQHLQPHHRNCSTFELVAASLWRCRTIALRLDPLKEVVLACTVSARLKLNPPIPKDYYGNTMGVPGGPWELVVLACTVSARLKLNPPIPKGYYGNTMAFPVAISTVGKICTDGIDYALDLVKKAKAQVTEEYIRSAADLAAVLRRPLPTVLADNAWLVTDNTRIGFEKIDFGWGKPVYGGPAAGLVRSERISFFARARNGEGESGVLVWITLPEVAMERFSLEVKMITEGCSKL